MHFDLTQQGACKSINDAFPFRGCYALVPIGSLLGNLTIMNSACAYPLWQTKMSAVKKAETTFIQCIAQVWGC